MLKVIKYNDVIYKFENRLNFLSENIIDIAITSYGAFTDVFDNGTGRRVELEENEKELTANAQIVLNNIHFNFSRCYTNYVLDTKELDKRQDIFCYAQKLKKNLNDNKTILPLISYYNNVSEFKNINALKELKDIIGKRDYGYKNCLIVNNKFDFAQTKYIEIILKSININQEKYYIINQMLNNIQNSIYCVGCSDLFYDIEEKSFFVKYKKKIIKITDLTNDLQIYIGIILDLHMRALALNPFENNPCNVSGCVGITYNFDKIKLNKLINTITKLFPNIQLLVLDKN